MEGDKETFVSGARTRHFNPLPPHGGRPGAFSCATMTQNISIHSLRMEGDGNALPQIISAILFQSTPSAWRETQGERHSGQCGHISIHSLRMEGDITSSLSLLLDRDFNPLPPHGGRPCRRTGSHSPLYHFNPLPPHGGRRPARSAGAVWQRFQSTPSAWRETAIELLQNKGKDISIHSLRMEGDVKNWCILVQLRHFNPLPPHGGRQKVTSSANDTKAFQSTPSAWRETYLKRQIESKQLFQSTPSAWRETVLLAMICTISSYFNPLPPHGGRRVIHFSDRFACHISIHSLRMEGDAQRSSHTPDRRYFNPLPPHGGRLLWHRCRPGRPYFNPLPPHGGRPIRVINIHVNAHFNPLPPHGGRP